MGNGSSMISGRYCRYVLPLAVACVVVAAWAVSSDSASPPSPAFGEQAVLNSHEPRGLISNIFGSTGSDGNPSVATGSEGVWITVWHTSDTQDGAIGEDWDIFYSRSTDGGKNFSTGQVLNSNADSDVGDDLHPIVVTDGVGNWVVAWASTATGGGMYGRDRDLMYCRSDDNGETWSTPAPLNVNAAQDYGNDWGVRMASDSKGNWVAVWASTDSLSNRLGGDGDIFVARSKDNGRSWTHPIPVNTNAQFDRGVDSDPDIAVDSDGHWVVIWSSSDQLGKAIGRDRDVLVARSTDVGASWTDPVPLNLTAATDTQHDWTPRLASNGKGVWVAVWSSADPLGRELGFDSDLLVARSTDGGTSWTRPVAVDPQAATDAQADASPSIVTDRLGNWMLVWHSFSAYSSYGQADSDVVVVVSQDEGVTWTAPLAINRLADEDTFDDSHPKLATDGKGNWVVVWQTYVVTGGMTVSDEVKSGWTVSTSHGRLVGPGSPQ